ncbi:hypothetical protein, partial [Burkholderia cenocepacia]|uniref:hypothetical protein n=6 Tax=Burkholderia cenocepacia TaxID=95486 RepID=UPI001C0E7EE2
MSGHGHSFRVMGIDAPGSGSQFIRRRTTLRSLDAISARDVFVVYPVFIEYMRHMCAHTHIIERAFRDMLSYVYAQKLQINPPPLTLSIGTRPPL